LTAGLIASLAGLAVHSQFETPQTVIVINSMTAIFLALLAAPLPVKPKLVGARLSASWPLIAGYSLALLMIGWSLYAYSAFSQGLAASYRGDWQGAARWIDETLRREPRLAYYWFQDGFAHGALALNSDGSVRDETELRLALEAYEHGLSLEDANSLNWANLSWLQWAAHDRAGGLSAMEQAVKLAPDSSFLMLNLARMYEDDGQENKALEAYHQVLALEPDWADHPNFQSTELRRNSIETMRFSDPDPQDGWNALEAGNYSLAEGLFRANLGINDARNHLGLGLALLGQDDLSGAEIALRTAQFIDSGLVGIFDAQARLYEEMGDPARASQAAASAKVLRDHPSTYSPGIMGESGVAWYIYHRETLPADLLPGLSMGWAW
jgi:tetratricopeptide (TPR) repeat protein